MKLVVGQHINNFIVLEDLGTRGKAHRHYYKVQCQCENKTIKELRGDAFPIQQSCGCSRKETYINNPIIKNILLNNLKKAQDKHRLPLGEGSFNALFYEYKQGAKKRRYCFELTKEYFRKLTKENCYHCGSYPKNFRNNRANNGEYIYNGIDRLDNNLGYTLGNCVPSCKNCNRMKMDLTLEEFYKHSKLINDYQRSK